MQDMERSRFACISHFQAPLKATADSELPTRERKCRAVSA
jgi:hypothetical protein